MQNEISPSGQFPEELQPGLSAMLDRIHAIESGVEVRAASGDASENGEQQNFQAWLNAVEATAPDFLSRLHKSIICSEFLCDHICSQPQWLVEQHRLDSTAEKAWAEIFFATLRERASQCGDEQALQALLRQQRNHFLAHIIWLELNRLLSLEQTTQLLSAFADTSIDSALQWLHTSMVAKHGEPIGNVSGALQQLCVIGMGKLGANELNLSSDVDLIFAYPEAGVTNAARDAISNQEFFHRLGQSLIRVLGQRTQDGFVFRVDMRLRPNGDSGPLVLNFSAIEDYYQQQGRDWERYALVKARLVGGDTERGAELLEHLKPFVYRRYIDFGAIDALRDMKRMIVQQVRRQSLQKNIKLGSGGIREIEFVVQSFQLIHGGRNPLFQRRSLLAMLLVLRAEECLDADTTQVLDGAYRFLRYTEHALQAWRDEQTQTLPGDDIARARLACAMGFADVDAFDSQLESVRSGVADIFAGVISGPEDEVVDAGASTGQTVAAERVQFWQWLWLDETLEDVSVLEVSDVEKELASQLLRFRDSQKVMVLEAIGRSRLERVIPVAMELIEREGQPLAALERVLSVIESILRRSVYLVLLQENHTALQQLVRLCALSPWICEQLRAYPALLDELLDARTLYSVPTRDQLADELRQQMLRVDPADLEAMMDVMRHFKLAHGLRVAACEVAGIMPLMTVSDSLTFIAEVILQEVLDFVWRELCQRHGAPLGVDGKPRDRAFIIVGYGKLGGQELGPASDLDLVFIHDADSQGETSGPKALPNTTFFNRLGQRMIHVLTTQTVSGELYEVDMRLRPSGSSGLLVSSFSGFENYQRGKAWVWEHQALVRARCVAGDPELGRLFTALRADILRQSRNREELREQVLDMRAKMRQHLDSEDTVADEQAQEFSLKQSRGGIVDIEFLVQYLVLAHAGEAPQLTDWTDKIRLLEMLEQVGQVSAEEATQLTEAYAAFRSQAHLAALQRLDARAKDIDFRLHRSNVERIWRHHLGEPVDRSVADD